MKYLLPLFSLFILGCTSTAPKLFSYSEYDASNTFNYANSFTYNSYAPYSELYAISQAQIKTNRGYHYLSKTFLTEHNKYWNDIAKSCHVEGAEYDFNLILVLDSYGGVLDVKKDTNLSVSKCFESSVKTIKYPETPFNFFYLLLNVNSNT